jgi:hypothetical protein
MEDLQYLINSPVASRQLNDLFASSWEEHQWRDFEPVLGRSLGYICTWLSRVISIASLIKRAPFDGSIILPLRTPSTRASVRSPAAQA